MTNSSAFMYVFMALFVGVGLGFVIGRGRKATGTVDTGQQFVQAQIDLASSKARAEQLDIQVGQLKEQLTNEQQTSNQQLELKKELESLKNQVTSFSTAAVDADRRRVEAEKEITTRIEEMKSNNVELAKSTNTIAKVLSSSQARGRFGEVQLELLLENAGLMNKENFDTQRVIIHYDESNARPDVTVNMPGGTSIFIDSKFPFEEYFNAYAVEDADQRKALLESHARVVRGHIRTLSERKYEDRAVSPNFVVLFAPIESILGDALKADPELLEYAFQCNVTIATPSTMMALLRTVGFVFSRESVAKNANEIRELAKDFLANITKLYGRLSTLGKRLNSTVTAFDDVVKYSEGTLLSPAKKIKALDIQGSPLVIPGEISKETRIVKDQSALSDEEIVEIEDLTDASD